MLLQGGTLILAGLLSEHLERRQQTARNPGQIVVRCPARAIPASARKETAVAQRHILGDVLGGKHRLRRIESCNFQMKSVESRYRRLPRHRSEEHTSELQSL